MEQLKFFKGKEEDLLKKTDIEAGAIYHCTDTKNTYLGTSQNGLIPYSSAIGKATNKIGGEIFNDYANNIAGEGAHAEGIGTTASGVGSHAEGCSDGSFSTVARGQGSHAEGIGTQAAGRGSHTEGKGTTASGIASHAEGNGSQTDGQAAHAEGETTKAYGNGAHAEGKNTTAGTSDRSKIGAHAEGFESQALNSSAHAEGYNTRATGDASHSEGNGTTASGINAHAEGEGTSAQGRASHAEGKNCEAVGDYSHAEGIGTFARADAQSVIGKYNEKDINWNYVHIVGNGNSDADRKNIHTLDWNGNAWFAGNLKIGGTGPDDPSAKEVSGNDPIIPTDDMFSGYDHFYTNIAQGRVNPEEPLEISTYDGSGQLTHPCVRYFPEGFGNH